MTDDCSCFPVPESQQTRYGNATEPGSAWEYNPECPEHGRSGPETPQANPRGVIPSAEDHGAAGRDLSGQPGAFSDVRFIPAGELWPNPAAAVRAERRVRDPRRPAPSTARHLPR